MKKSELRAYTLTALRNIVRDENLEITGAWKMKKDELVEKIYIEVSEAWEMENDELEEVEKPEPIKETRSICLINTEDEIVNEFQSLAEAKAYCVKNRVMNMGWTATSLRENRPAYFTKDGKPTPTRKNNPYTGQGWRLAYID